MRIQYISELLDLPELTNIQMLSIDSEALHLEAQPVEPIQCCPICQLKEPVIRKGYNAARVIRHLPVFGKRVYLHLPSIRMFCSDCQVSFVWRYAFVGPKQRYSQYFRSQTVEQALGSTAAHSARM